MRFYELNSGILVDGVDITRLKREDLRDIFGMVLQDTWLQSNGTICENIRYGRQDASDEEVVHAADTATQTISSAPCQAVITCC